MKKTILPALAMLIISAVMLSTASYAWFAMSRSVSANNMTVSIKSDSSYLLISESTFNAAENVSTSVNFAAASTPLLPVTFDDATGLNADSFTGSNTWYDRVAENSATSTAPEKIDDKDNINYITTENLGKYVYTKTVYIAVSEESNALGALRVSGVNFVNAGGNTDRDAINVVVVSTYTNAEGAKESVYQRFCASDVKAGLGKSWGTIQNGTALAPNVPQCDAANIQVDIHIFFNGDHRWKWMFNNYYGIFNYVGKDVLGILDKNINWLGDPKFALGCIILILLTTSVGQPIVLYVSALDNVDKSLVEAAEVDGASSKQAFWRIKWPQIMPTTLYILIITTINSFQCFALIQLLTSGGPKNSTMTIMYYIYYSAFKLYKYGYGNAMGVILAIIIAILSAIQFKAGQEK